MILSPQRRAIKSAIVCKTNAELIARIAPLWLPDHLPVVDFTYGKGLWWARHMPPAGLTAHDLYTVDGCDYRKPLDDWHDDLSIPVAVFDPPYAAVGGDETSTIPDFNERYGLHTFDKRTPDLIQQGIIEGLAHIFPKLVTFQDERRRVRTVNGERVVDYVPAVGGWVLVKCMNYISGGRMVIGEFETMNAAMDLGYSIEDRFLHVSGSRAQPTINLDGSPRRQVHSHANYSTLLVLGKRRQRGR